MTQAPYHRDPSPPSLITATGLTKAYGPTRALAGVDLNVAPGEALAVMGPSGSGKSTLLHCLAGIVTPDTGSVRMDLRRGQVEMAGLSDGARAAVRRRDLGFVFQDGLLLPELTALENVALPLMLTGAGRRSAQTHAAGWLQHLGLAGMEHRRLGQLSGGQVQRVAVARAQVNDPDIVFADEPTGALDSATSAEVMAALLGATVARGAALIVVTHDETVARSCHRLVVLRDGLVASDEWLAESAGRC